MSGVATNPVADTFPSASFPTVFVDGVLNVTFSASVIKYYLFRFDPSLKGDNQFQTQPVAQVVTSIEGFTTATLFLYQHLERLIEKNLITRERVEELGRLVMGGQ